MNTTFPLPDAVCELASGSPGSVLLETSRIDVENRTSYLFLDPVRILTANEPGEIAGLFHGIEAALAEGYFVAGYLAYEAGYALQGLTSPVCLDAGTPLAWFGVFTEPACFDHLSGRFCGGAMPSLSSSPAPLSTTFSPDEVALTIDPECFARKIEEIKGHIAAGATYQINFTDRIHLQSKASPVEMYHAFVRRQPVAYSALLNVGSMQILSISPELFFRVHDCRIATRPMKGTWQRGRDSVEDAVAALELQNDEKNRSEHLMIVDLLRNDLGRICVTGSIRVEDLFTVERYSTLLQMSSTISGMLPSRLPWIDVFRSLFPSGSITGAPKLSSMGIIRDLEDSPRGIYTGSIGYIAPNGDAVFNVAIRTLTCQNGSITMGVGSGIVIDSDASAEYAECRLKAAFLTHLQTYELIETMRWDGTFVRLPLHMERLRRSCDYFGFPFDGGQIMAKLEELAAIFSPQTRHRVRLSLDRRGNIALSSKLLSLSGDRCAVRLSPERTLSSDSFLRHKTTCRVLYDRELSAAQADDLDEVFFFNERGELTEGAISNIFLRCDGKLYTPPLSSGVLPGVFRRFLLDTLPSAEERVLTLSDLSHADAIYICNSLRGMRKVTRIDLSGGPANISLG